MPACANAAQAGRPAMLSVKLADLVTAPVTERVAANAWVPPETAPVVVPAPWLGPPPRFVASVAVLEEPHAAIRSATLASATIPATLRRTYGSNLIRPFSFIAVPRGRGRGARGGPACGNGKPAGNADPPGGSRRS